MSENGVVARLVALEGSTRALWDEHAEHRKEISTMKADGAVSSHRIDEAEKLADRLEVRIDRMTKAFWTTAATLGGLSLTAIGVIVAVLTRGA